jgi:hypothetical protein
VKHASVRSLCVYVFYLLCCLLQNFILTWHKDIRPKGRTMCWDVSDVQNKAAVNLFPCHGMQGNQLWRYNPVRCSIMLEACT